jgi:hypothetical protein
MPVWCGQVKTTVLAAVSHDRIVFVWVVLLVLEDAQTGSDGRSHEKRCSVVKMNPMCCLILQFIHCRDLLSIDPFPDMMMRR